MTIALVIVFCLAVPFLGTALGSTFVFFTRGQMSPAVEKSLLGFASGVMVAASVWSLIIPAIDMAGGHDAGIRALLPALVGFMLGMFFLLYIDHITPHQHVGADKPEGPASRMSSTKKMVMAVTIHNLPEGMAVGVVLAGLLDGSADITAAGAIAVTLGMAIQNIPEGAIISLPLHAAGTRRPRAWTYGVLSGAVEPIGAAIVIALAGLIRPVIPYMLAFAAGAMIYVVIEDLIPQATRPPHTNHSPIGFALGFILMMTLDVLLG